MINPISKIYSIRFFSNFCQAMFFPFFALWMLQEKIFTATEAAFIVSFGLFATRFASILCAPILTKCYKKYILLYSLCLLSFIYWLFYWLYLHHIIYFFIWFILSILAGGTLSCITLSLLVLIAMQQKTEDHHQSFSLNNIALNLSSGLGPYCGAILVARYANYFPLLPILFSLTAFIVCLFLNKDNKTASMNDSRTPHSIRTDAWFFFITINIFTAIAYAQFYDIFPTYAGPRMTDKTIGMLFIVSSITIVLSQIPITKYVTYIRMDIALISAQILLAIGNLLFIQWGRYYILMCILGVIFISLAEVVYVPVYQTFAVRLFHAINPARGLAWQNFFWGLAEASATFWGIFLIGHHLGFVSLFYGALFALFTAFLCFKRGIFMNTIYHPAIV